MLVALRRTIGHFRAAVWGGELPGQASGVFAQVLWSVAGIGQFPLCAGAPLVLSGPWWHFPLSLSLHARWFHVLPMVALTGLQVFGEGATFFVFNRRLFNPFLDGSLLMRPGLLLAPERSLWALVSVHPGSYPDSYSDSLSLDKNKTVLQLVSFQMIMMFKYVLRGPQVTAHRGDATGCSPSWRLKLFPNAKTKRRACSWLPVGIGWQNKTLLLIWAT